MLRSSVVLDETMVKMHGFRAYVWSTVDVDSWRFLAIYGFIE